jgi:hypothetical protein
MHSLAVLFWVDQSMYAGVIDFSPPHSGPGARQQKSAGVNSFAQIKKDLKPYMGQ